MPSKIATRNDGRYGKEAARVVIVRGSEFTPSGRRRIAQWLRRQAAFLEKHNDRMAKRYTARWLYS